MSALSGTPPTSQRKRNQEVVQISDSSDSSSSSEIVQISSSSSSSYEEEEEDDDVDIDCDDADDLTWVERFVRRKGNEYFCEVSEAWLKDAFNLYGLPAQTRGFVKAFKVILDSYDSESELPPSSALLRTSETLYGQIHARFIVTPEGLQSMRDKYRKGHFGYCPRVLCHSHALLPIGQSDLICQHSVKLFCPQCEEIYNPKNPLHQEIDGAFFGTSFAHMFLMQFPETKKPIERYVPKIFGFKLHKPPATSAQPVTPKMTLA